PSARSGYRVAHRCGLECCALTRCFPAHAHPNVAAGIVNDAMVISVRNLGYTKNAGEFVRRFFADIGSAGGHRAMAKAVVPMQAFRDKFGDLSGDAIGPKLQSLAHEFLQHESTARDGRDGREVRSQKSEARSAEPAEIS